MVEVRRWYLIVQGKRALHIMDPSLGQLTERESEPKMEREQRKLALMMVSFPEVNNCFLLFVSVCFKSTIDLKIIFLL